MKEEIRSNYSKRVRRIGTTGIWIGILSVLACELPIALTVVGLGGLSSAASLLSLPPMIEMVGVVIGLSGLLLIAGIFTYRFVSRVKL
ncbi:MAG: hypothetical protein ACI8XU_002743 [Kiritimatiellia bacterium]|jgi:hypothetical protein